MCVELYDIEPNKWSGYNLDSLGDTKITKKNSAAWTGAFKCLDLGQVKTKNILNCLVRRVHCIKPDLQCACKHGMLRSSLVVEIVYSI